MEIITVVREISPVKAIRVELTEREARVIYQAGLCIGGGEGLQPNLYIATPLRGTFETPISQVEVRNTLRNLGGLLGDILAGRTHTL